MVEVVGCTVVVVVGTSDKVLLEESTSRQIVYRILGYKQCDCSVFEHLWPHTSTAGGIVEDHRTGQNNGVRGIDMPE